MISAYQTLSTANNFQHDDAQHTAVVMLDKLSKTIQQQEEKSWLSYRFSKSDSISGVYLFGRVGRGKTMLMDLFFENLAITAKKRIHFHRFMEEVHQQLNLCSGKSDPLILIAKSWAKNIKVLCFDEFFVSDIGDAMLLTGLFKALFQQGIILITTSNCHPDQLYRNGLQRERFLPTIDLLKKNCQVLSIDGEVDHRLAHFEQAMEYRDYSFSTKSNDEIIAQRFKQLTGIKIKSGEIIINHRVLSYQAKDNKVISFDFYELCSAPRSQRDYMSLADRFDTVLLDNVPQFQGERLVSVTSGVEDGYQRKDKILSQLCHLDDEARRFIALVDEFYDRKVRLIINAEVDIIELYQGQQLSFEFARCQSRLIEMQNLQY